MDEEIGTAMFNAGFYISMGVAGLVAFGINIFSISSISSFLAVAFIFILSILSLGCGIHQALKTIVLAIASNVEAEIEKASD